MSSLILYIDLRQICYFIMFILNWPMLQWRNGGWLNYATEKKNKTSHLFSHKYWICLFVLFSNPTFLPIIKNKQNLIRYCNASSFFLLFKTLRLKNYVNILSIIATLSPSASFCRCRCWRLVVVIGVSDLENRHRSRRCRHLVVVAVSLFLEAASILVAASVVFCALSSLPLLLGLSSSAASRCCFRRRLLVVGVVVVVVVIRSHIVGGVSLLSSTSLLAAELRSSLKILVYIWLTMHTTTMEPQHQSQNGPALL